MPECPDQGDAKRVIEFFNSRDEIRIFVDLSESNNLSDFSYLQTCHKLLYTNPFRVVQ